MASNTTNEHNKRIQQESSNDSKKQKPDENPTVNISKVKPKVGKIFIARPITNEKPKRFLVPIQSCFDPIFTNLSDTNLNNSKNPEIRDQLTLERFNELLTEILKDVPDDDKSVKVDARPSKGEEFDLLNNIPESIYNSDLNTPEPLMPANSKECIAELNKKNKESDIACASFELKWNKAHIKYLKKLKENYSKIISLKQSLIEFEGFKLLSNKFDELKGSLKTFDSMADTVKLIQNLLKSSKFFSDETFYFDKFEKMTYGNGKRCLKLVETKNTLWNAVSCFFFGNTCMSVGFRLLAACEFVGNSRKNHYCADLLENLFELTHGGKAEHIILLANIMKRPFLIHYNDGTIEKIGKVSEYPVILFKDGNDFMAVLEN
jgi:hypothetical protein